MFRKENTFLSLFLAQDSRAVDWNYSCIMPSLLSCSISYVLYAQCSTAPQLLAGERFFLPYSGTVHDGSKIILKLHLIFHLMYYYRGSHTSTVSTSTISTSTNFVAIGIKLVLVELLCSKISTSGNWLCSTHQYEFRIVRFFQNPKNRTKRGPPVNSGI